MARTFLMAARSLSLQPRRTFLLGGLIAAVTALLVLQSALLSGARASLYQTATTMLTGQLNVSGFFKLTPAETVPVLLQPGALEAAIKKAFPQVEGARLRGRGAATLVGPKRSLQVPLVALDVTREPSTVAQLRWVQGNLLELAQPGTTALFKKQALKLGVSVGDTVLFSAKTQRGTSNTLDARVVAVLEDSGMSSYFGVLLPLSSWRQLFQYQEHTVSSVQLSLRPDAEDAMILRPRLLQVVKDQGFTLLEAEPGSWVRKLWDADTQPWTGQQVDVSTWYDESSMMSGKLDALNVLSALITFILLAVIAVGIMNTAWVSIQERTREIGTLRAMGMHRGQVLRMFFFEALILGLLSTLAGALLGALVCLGINALNVPLPISVEFWLFQPHLVLAVDAGVLLGPIFSILLATSLASLIPSLLASRLSPVKAMSHAG